MQKRNAEHDNIRAGMLYEHMHSCYTGIASKSAYAVPTSTLKIVQQNCCSVRLSETYFGGVHHHTDLLHRSFQRSSDLRYFSDISIHENGRRDMDDDMDMST